MKNIILFLLMAISFNVSADCKQEIIDYGFCSEITWLHGPYDGQTSSFVIEFKNSNNEVINLDSSYHVDIFSWMVMSNGHSHGGPRMTNELNEGQYLVEDARFFMGRMNGYWLVKVHLSNESGVFYKKSFPVDL